jgi:flagellar FliJ protein
MAQAFRFAFLLERAREQREKAATEMGEARARRDAGRDKLAQLESFRSEYRQRLTHTGMQGIAAHQWQDFRLFITRLDQAVEQQQIELARLEARFQQTLTAWQQCEREVKAFEALQARHEAEARQREAKAEQRLNDEAAARRRRASD